MTTPTDTNAFKKLLAIDVNKYVERKGQFAYLSWPFAVSQLRLADPNATWDVKRFDGLPYLKTELGYFVEVAVTVQGITLSQVHPVLDARNKPIPAPTVFDLNTSIQRCLVKAIALHGLGLSIYAGEDLPIDQEDGRAEPPTPSEPQPSTPIAPRQPAEPSKPSRSKVSPLPPRPQAPAEETFSAPSHYSGDGITPAQIKYIERLIDDTGTHIDEVLDYFGFFTLDTISKSDASRVIKALESKRRVA